MKKLIIKWQRLLSEDNQTCQRCGSTEEEIEKAVQKLKQHLAPLGIVIILEKISIDFDAFIKDVSQSNRLWIAGKSLEEWLGAGVGQSPCCGPCGDAECRTVELADKTYEVIPADLIIKAGLLAASQVFDVKLPQLDHQQKSAIKVLPKSCCE